MVINKDEELHQVTVLKTVMMLCVLFYHVLLALQGNGWGGIRKDCSNIDTNIRYVAAWLNSFHIQTFTFASGYLFYMIRYENDGYRDIKNDLLKRWMRLMFPFYAVSLLWAIPGQIFAYGFSWNMIIKDFILEIAPAQLWFLPMLYLVYLVFYFFSDLIERVPVHIVLILYAVIYVTKVVLGKFIPLGVFQISSTIEYLLYYYIGFIIRKKTQNKGGKIRTFVIVFAAFILEFMYLFMYFKIENLIIAEIFRPIACSFQVLAVLEFAKIVKIERLNYLKGFNKISYNSMGIYLFHQQILYLTMRILSNVPPTLFVVLNFIFAFLISNIITNSLRKTKMGKLILGI